MRQITPEVSMGHKDDPTEQNYSEDYKRLRSYESRAEEIRKNLKRV